MKQEIIDKINRLASQDEPFLFVINYQGDKAFIRQLSDINPEECLFDFEGRGNSSDEMKNNSEKIAEISWQIAPPLYEDYERSFDIVKNNIMAGNSYLTNLTCKVPVSCNLSLEDIFHRAKGKYKLLLRRKRNLNPFVCFSPETFVRIKDGRIYSYPMKGTLDASLPNAEKQLMEDRKEAAEHATIVDLIRNDLSRVAENVRVDKYRYIDVLHTNKGDILQTSSEISGRLPEDYPHHLGEILDAQLPAGSITGAPKDKTMQIIQEAEGYDRGFYTGIMGIYDQGELNSAVMIRFVEEEASPSKTEKGKNSEVSRELYFKAGGGITSKSDCRREYEEVIQKIYLPIQEKNKLQNFCKWFKYGLKAQKLLALYLSLRPVTIGSGRVELTYESSADDIKDHKTEICRNDETAICRNNKNQERQGPGPALSSGKNGENHPQVLSILSIPRI